MTRQPDPGGWHHWQKLGQEILLVIFSHPWWLLASVVSTVIHAALQPSLAWMGRSFVNDLQNPQTSVSGSLWNYAVVFGGVVTALAAIKFGNQVLNKIYESRVVIVLQRTYLQRRGDPRGSQDISRLLYDAEQAKRGLDILYKDSWSIVAHAGSVLVWQWSLSPEWLPALLLAVMPPLALVLVLGRWVQQSSLRILQLQAQIAGSTAQIAQPDLFRYQESFFRYGTQLEALKAGSEVVMDLMLWFGLLLLALLAAVVNRDLLPQEIQAGDLALFAVNLNLLSKPLGEIVKVYTKGRESYPALLRMLWPQEEISRLQEDPCA